METLAPVGPVYQAGTLSGNPLATAAGLAVLSELDQAAYEELTSRVERFARQLREALEGALGAEVRAPRAGPLMGIFFSREPVTDYDGAKASAATGRYPALMHGLLDRGIAIAPGAYEAFFPSLAHTPEELAATAAAFGEAAAATR